MVSERQRGNGNPLQCSCLENPRDGEAWWAAVYGVAQSLTRLKWLNSSSSTINRMNGLWAGCFLCFLAFNSDHKPRKWPLVSRFSVGKVKTREIELPKVTELISGKTEIWTWEGLAKASAGHLLLYQVKLLSLDQSHSIHVSLCQRSQTVLFFF